MTGMFQRWKALRQDRKAVTALEYGLIAACVVAVGLASFSVIGDSLAGKVTNIEATLNND